MIFSDHNWRTSHMSSVKEWSCETIGWICITCFDTPGVLDMIVWNHFHREYLGPGNISRHFYDILKAFLRWAIFRGLCSLILWGLRYYESLSYLPKPNSRSREYCHGYYHYPNRFQTGHFGAIFEWKIHDMTKVCTTKYHWYFEIWASLLKPVSIITLCNSSTRLQ